MSQNNVPGGTVVSVSCPGGMARQFRVQVHSAETSSRWKLVGSFRDRAQARECAERLRRDGQQSRVIDCCTLPTAA
jgi:hypothetical protein